MINYPTAFLEALADTLQYEGGYVNHPSDPGGATNFGITQKVYSDYCRAHGKAAQSVKNITSEEVQAIYYTNYWLASQCQWLPAKIARAVFDFAVNSGVSKAIKTLQGIIGTSPDGVFGKASGEALNRYIAKHTEVVLVYEYLRQREIFFQQIAANRPKMRVFLKGWLNRVRALSKKLIGR